uniref:Putative secreted peptide n=1 Tax=Anopheles braziliensis TaxID=58242 RepID=A0A2M3ZWR2_9DIPT
MNAVNAQWIRILLRWLLFSTFYHLLPWRRWSAIPDSASSLGVSFSFHIYGRQLDLWLDVFAPTSFLQLPLTR